MEFLNKAKIRFEFQDGDRVKWFSLKEDLIFSTTGDKDIIVPKDIFLTDLASVPHGLQWMYKSSGLYTSSAILHDYLYSNRALKQKYCDKIFLVAMKSQKVKFHTRWLFYFAVRLFGGFKR